MRIGNREISRDVPPMIVAEMSGNHNGSLQRALAIVDAAAESGAHALKLQTYTADTMTIDVDRPEFVISDRRSLWKGETLYRLYQKAYTPWEWHREIFERCRRHGMIAFSTPFDPSAVDFLEELGVPAYKIASPELVDLPLIRKAASTGKPLIISTGMATEQEIVEAVETARTAGCSEIVLLKCVSEYPAPPEDANLATLADMRQRFGTEVGLSDHSPGIGVAVAAAALGAVIIEKHFTLSRKDGGVDAAFSLEPAELRALVTESERAWKAVGRVRYGPAPSDERHRSSRRSLYVVRDIRAGELLTPANVRIIRPGRGLPPKYIDQVLGRRARCDLPRGTPLTWDVIE